jgi:RimJ/RimL family protein N-acetyltransferase
MPEITLPLRTERLVLRRFEGRDLDTFHAYHSLPETARFLPGPAKSYTKSMESVGKYANFSFDKEGDWICLAIEAADGPGLLGEVVLKWVPGRGQAEVGWTLAPEARGQGYGSEAAAAVLDLGRPATRPPCDGKWLRPALEDQVPVELGEHVAVHHP